MILLACNQSRIFKKLIYLVKRKYNKMITKYLKMWVLKKRVENEF